MKYFFTSTWYVATLGTEWPLKMLTLVENLYIGRGDTHHHMYTHISHTSHFVRMGTTIVTIVHHATVPTADSIMELVVGITHSTINGWRMSRSYIVKVANFLTNGLTVEYSSISSLAFLLLQSIVCCCPTLISKAW